MRSPHFFQPAARAYFSGRPAGFRKRSLTLEAALLLFLAAQFLIPFDGLAQEALEPIRILGISRTNDSVSLRWRGGFAPYRVRFRNSLNSSWAELPGSLDTNAVMLTAASSSGFFDVKTEFEPIRITGLYADTEFVSVRWSGGMPPYRVQARDFTATNWIDLPGVIKERYYLNTITQQFNLFRVRTEPDTNAPSPPSTLSVPAIQCDRLVLIWSQAEDGLIGSGIKHYNLYQGNEIISQTMSPKAYVFIKDLVPESRYELEMTAVDFAGNESAKSVPLSIVMPKCPVIETNDVGKSSSITLEWDRNEEPDVAGYIVHWGLQPSDNTWEMDAMQATEVTIFDLEPGTPYFFTVTAYTTEGVGSEPSENLIFLAP